MIMFLKKYVNTVPVDYNNRPSNSRSFIPLLPPLTVFPVTLSEFSLSKTRRETDGKFDFRRCGKRMGFTLLEHRRTHHRNGHASLRCPNRPQQSRPADRNSGLQMPSIVVKDSHFWPCYSGSRCISSRIHLLHLIPPYHLSLRLLRALSLLAALEYRPINHSRQHARSSSSSSSRCGGGQR